MIDQSSWIEALEQIDWATLQTSEGNAEEFPDWIMQLASQDEAWRIEGMEALWRTCSPPCEATAYVVPFLLHLLEAEGVHGKDELMHMLASFTITPPNNVDEQAARDAVYHGLNLCSIFLESENAAEREGAASLLSRFPDEYLTVRTLLRATTTAEPYDSIKVKMIDSYGGLVERYGANPEDGLWIAEFTRSYNAPPCQFHAALWASRWLCDNTPPHVIRILNMAILTPAFFAKYPSDLLYGPIVENACDALCKLAPDHALGLLMKLLPQITDPDDAHVIASRLLDLAFNGKVQRFKYASLPEDYAVDRPNNSAVQFRIHKSTPERQSYRRRKGRFYPPADTALDLATVTPLQRAVLETVLKCDNVWLLHSNLLELIGLPASRSIAQGMIAL